jgi:hypothetical protein
MTGLKASNLPKFDLNHFNTLATSAELKDLLSMMKR